MKKPDYTFWVRLNSFLEDITVNCAMGFEELEYLKYVSKQQLKQQFENATGEEKEYLVGLKIEEKIK